MLRSINKLKTIPKCFGFFRSKGLIQGARFMSIQIVHQLSDFFGVFVTSSDLLDENRPLHLCFALSYINHPCSGQRFVSHKKSGMCRIVCMHSHAVPAVLASKGQES